MTIDSDSQISHAHVHPHVKPYRLLDLFSGIGGFSLGLERSGGFKTVAFCEIDQFCRKVLAKHWPEVPCYDDVRSLTAERLAADGIVVDAICGGFPCQDISIAGRGAGIEGTRSGLWREIVRLIQETRPKYAIIENSPQIRSRGLEVMLGALDAIGYDAEWHCIPAAHVGAPHRRDRIWIIAYRQGHSLGSYPHLLGLYPPQMHVEGSVELLDKQERVLGSLAWWGAEPELERVVDGNLSRLDIARIRAVGNAVVPQIPQLIGRAILAAEARA